MTSLFFPQQRPKSKPTQKDGKIPRQNRYLYGYRWCGKCGQWVAPDQIKNIRRCPDCNYVLRMNALLRSQREDREVARH